MIPVYKPWLTKLEKKYLDEAYNSTWISSTGKFINKAEQLLADFLKVKHCIVTTSGTTALHLCLRALDKHIDNDSDVVVPNTTFVASAFAPAYDNRNIKFIDIDKHTWNLDIDQLENYLTHNNVSAVIAVHLYGNPVDMFRLNNLKSKFGFKIIEDACESLGAKIMGRKTGSMGDINCFSFYGNKTVTCGEGGAVTTNDDDLANNVRLLRGQAQDTQKRYWHIDIGYNYRMTNMQAAILCGQLERIDEILNEKQRVADRYYNNLKNTSLTFQKVLISHKHSNWLISFKSKHRDKIINHLKKHGIETRPVFYPINTMPPFIDSNILKNSIELSMYGLSVPSYPTLTNKQIDNICNLIKEVI